MAFLGSSVTPQSSYLSGIPGMLADRNRAGLTTPLDMGLSRRVRRLGKYQAAGINPNAPPTEEAVASGDASNGGGGSGGGGWEGPYDDVLAGYEDFAKTGGFSPADIANIRARNLSPIRAIYANAMRNVDRQRTLQNGYAPNYMATIAKLAREQSYTTSDAATNAEADLAEMRNEGRLAGLQGLSGLLSRSGGGGGGGGGSAEDAGLAPTTPKKKSFWDKFGGVLKGVGKVALPIALAAIPGVGPYLGATAGVALNRPKPKPSTMIPGQIPAGTRL